MNILISPRCLLPKLVARKIQNLKSAVAVRVVYQLQVGILGCETAFCGGVHHQQHLSLIVGQRHGVPVSVCHAELINVVSYGGFSAFGIFLVATPHHQGGCHANGKNPKLFHCYVFY